ncbi:MAG: c-type cytochrome [Coriobacteriia bacterium]|nr:c-type cytochrome [Coriobacteriia bacterium]MDO9107443.1 c-type cytochrome [Coriobacteriia bacterium]
MNRASPVWAVSLIAIGVTGMLMVIAWAPSWTSSAFTSTGQQIYYTGSSAKGPIARTIAGGAFMGPGMMLSAACVDCHGEDGRGGRFGMMFGPVDVPDIRYSALAATRSKDGTTTLGWTESDIERAIRDGVEPDGGRIKAPMPRWHMTDTEVQSVIDYLKEMDRR